MLLLILIKKYLILVYYLCDSNHETTLLWFIGLIKVVLPFENTEKTNSSDKYIIR